MTEKELDEWLEDNIDYSADSEHNAKQIAKQIPELKDKTKELADALDKAMDDDTIEKPFTYAIQKTLTANAPVEKEEPANQQTIDDDEEDMLTYNDGDSFYHSRFGRLTYNADNDDFVDSDGDHYDADTIDFEELEKAEEPEFDDDEEDEGWRPPRH